MEADFYCLGLGFGLVTRPRPRRQPPRLDAAQCAQGKLA